ncbi:hypothetical protein NLX83_12755 [Allokutzneria sp. A3M-2-11 16]|uniref:hypothetical protein n=1 Tax=Allokutzneria sp. A3M-2-11 16 TaxID=2962043 RepID=UPI0020B71119|nr:hypothetical protein [Allokutzneria sp. A3M-2-11 16]MCP3800128.1 hypothetical protein [Allokutzneria sp. A3M-2-11 16]
MSEPVENIVLFDVGREEPDQAEVPAKVVDGVVRAWRQVAREHGVTPAQVTGIHAMWEPSVLDRKYIELTFPGVECSAAFSRPAPDGWDAAFEQAREVLDSAIEKLDEEEMDQAVDGMLSTAGEGVLLLVLRSTSLPRQRASRIRTTTRRRSTRRSNRSSRG